MSTEQLDLLAPSRRDDPPESREAAAKVDALRQYHLVLRTLSGAPGGLSDDEIAERTGLLRNSAGTRRGVAVKEGLVEKCGRSETPRGNPCGLWRLTDAGRRYVREELNG